MTSSKLNPNEDSASRPSKPSASRTEVALDDATVEAIAQRVVELLRGETPQPDGGLVDAAALAERLGTTRSWVYTNADELGARRLGDGPKARLRFDPVEAERAISCSTSRRSPGQVSPAKRRNRRRPRSTGNGTSAPLLPIRGRTRLDEAA